MKTALLFMVILGGCNKHIDEVEATPDPYKLACSDDLTGTSNDSVFRCENKEVVCYLGDGHQSIALVCKWKSL